MADPLLRRWAKNDWDFEPKNSEQVLEFNYLVQTKLTEVEQRMLLCLLHSEEGLTLLKNTLYK